MHLEAFRIHRLIFLAGNIVKESRTDSWNQTQSFERPFRCSDSKAFIFWAFIKGQFLSDLIEKCTLGVGTIIPSDICTNLGDSIAVSLFADREAAMLPTV